MSIKASSEVTPAYIYESNVHVANVLSTLNEQRKSGLLCDITIIVQGIDFKAHKAILASCSSYFNRIITDPANVSHNIVLELSSISKLGMESLLEFAYTSKLAVTCNNIDDIICAAHELEFKNIEFSCLNYLKQQLTSGISASSILNSHETSSVCGNSRISRKVECARGPTNIDTIGSGKSTSKYDCPIMSKLKGSKKKENPCGQISAAPNPYICDDKKDICDQMSQEQHREMIKQILEKHGLEAASTVDDKAMEVAASEVAPECGNYTSAMEQVRASCPGGGVEKKRCLSRYVAPLCNSDTEGSADEEGACSMMRSSGKLRKQPAIKLPFTMDEITSMPRSNLHELLTRNPNLSQEQICAIHEIRRRGKNRIAAQRCRKRKMECIRSLVAEIEVLRTEHANLMSERRQARDQAQKLSDKFKAKCEKFFKCEKKCKLKLCSNNHGSSEPSNAIAPEEQNLLGQDEVSVKSFQEHAERAYELYRRLKEVPCDDLPACSTITTPDCSVWANPCMSPPECEVVVCDSGGGDSSDAGSILQAASPASSFNESACAMSPSQRLSDFGNIYISPPGHPSDTISVVTSGTSRTSVVLHTSSVDNKGHCTKSVPAVNSLTQTFVTYPTQCIPTAILPQTSVAPPPGSCHRAFDKMNVDDDQLQK